MPAFLIWKYERRNTYAELCELFCGIYEWSHSFAIAISGCTGVRDWTGESNETSSGRNADICIVCLGAAASAVVNIYLGTALGVGRTDMGRIPAGVVSGIGFLGVGTIIITGKNQVRGLTTAAGLWTTATLGIMLGSGMLEISLMMFALIIVTMFGIARVSRVQEQYNRYIGLYMEIDKSMTRGVYDYINECGYELSSVEKKRDKTLKGSDIVLTMMLDLKKRRNHAEVLSEVSQIEGVHYLEEV